MSRSLNAVLYQIGWFSCVLGAAFSRPGIGVSIALLLIGIHLYLTTERANQLKLMMLAACVGLVVDSTLLALGVYRFPGETPLAGLPPLWLTVLWIQFATTFRYCFGWLSSRYLLCAAFGLAGAPLAFLGGEKLGAVEILPPQPINLALLGGLWCVAIPLLIAASDRIHASNEIPSGYRGFPPSSGSVTVHPRDSV
jgi:hypothetical protein